MPWPTRIQHVIVRVLFSLLQAEGIDETMRGAYGRRCVIPPSSGQNSVAMPLMCRFHAPAVHRGRDRHTQKASPDHCLHSLMLLHRRPDSRLWRHCGAETSCSLPLLRPSHSVWVRSDRLLVRSDDRLRRQLGHHVHRRSRPRVRRHLRLDRRIHNPQPLDAHHLEVRVHDVPN